MTDPLIVDVYQGDGKKDWRAFVAAGAPWAGVVFKATQGTYYRPPWYAEERRAFLDAAGERLAATLFEGAYHYLDFQLDGAAQADYFVRAVELAGGEQRDTLWGMVDVERGGQRVQQLTKALVADCTNAFAARYLQLTGRTATLYGGELLREVGITDRLGCGRSAIALYGASLPPTVVTQTGTDLDHLLLWQYSGTEAPARLPGYPNLAPGCGKVDISAMVLPGGIEKMRSMMWAEAPAPGRAVGMNPAPARTSGPSDSATS